MTSPPSIGDSVTVNGSIAARVVSAGLDVVCVAIPSTCDLLEPWNHDLYDLYWCGLDEIEPAPPAA